MEDLQVNDRLTLPGRYLRAEAVRAGGPGGQHVNKASTKAVLLFDIVRCPVLSEEVKDRLRSAAGRRVDTRGQLRLACQRTRSQARNIEECRARLAALIRRALSPPPPRKRTRPPARERADRLEEKRRNARKKALRRPPDRRDE